MPSHEFLIWFTIAVLAGVFLGRCLQPNLWSSFFGVGAEDYSVRQARRYVAREDIGEDAFGLGPMSGLVSALFDFVADLMFRPGFDLAIFIKGFAGGFLVVMVGRYVAYPALAGAAAEHGGKLAFWLAGATTAL